MNPPKIYKTRNKWQSNRYAFMSEYNKKFGIKKFGTAWRGGNANNYGTLFLIIRGLLLK